MIINRIERRSIPPRALTESMTSIAQGVVVQAASTSEYTVDDTQTPTGDAGTLSALLNWIGHMVKAITGKANWRTAPARTLEQCVDTAGLTTNTVPVATGARTLSDSPIAVSSGKVGIGITSSLTGKLHVKSTDATAAVRVENTYSGNGVDVSMVGAGGGVAISHTGTGHGITMSKSSSGRGLHLTHSGSGDCLFVSNTNTGNGLVVTLTGSGKGAVITTLDTIGVQVSMSGNGSAADLVSIGHTGSSYTGNGYRVTLTSSGHGVKVLQEGTGKGGEFTIYNAANSAIALDVYTNGSGIAIKGKTEGAGRAAFFEVNRSSATDPAVEIKITNTSDAGVGLRVNGLGTGSMLQVQDNGTNVLEVKDGSKIGFYGVAAVARAGALTAKDTSTVDATYGTQERDVINNNRTRIGEIETALKNIGILT